MVLQGHHHSRPSVPLPAIFHSGGFGLINRRLLGKGAPDLEDEEQSVNGRGKGKSWRVHTLCFRIKPFLTLHPEQEANADPDSSPTIRWIETRVRSGGPVSRETISTVRWEDYCCSFKATPESKRAPKSNGCQGSSQVQQKQGPREMATKRSSSSESQVVLKAILLFHFHFCHPAQSRPSMAENRAGGDEEPEDAVMVVVVGATCSPLPLVRSPPYRRKVAVKVDVHDGQDKTRAMEAVSSFKGIDSITADLKNKKLAVIGNVDPVDVKMSSEAKKIVVKLNIQDEEDKSKVIRATSNLIGIDTISVDLKDKKLTVIGRIDPVRLTRKLRKHYHAEILSIRSEREEEKKEEPKKSEETERAGKNKEAGAVARAWNGYDPYVIPHYVPVTEEDPIGCAKVVVKLNILDEKEQRNAMRAVSDLKGIHTISADLKGKKLTVIGNIDPVSVVIKLRKHYLTE
ncbi:Heavy metal-associated domain containing protein [Musa troglodytarum]|uniref:Heavy metal-associated domain containing protein n=1 Tax=Musa troglodytarum TaxID=320322 RepID=A0A9E7JUC9_9LILI|nr:Heavy metal-associated domain containing protein [Musa troglodytarum]